MTKITPLAMLRRTALTLLLASALTFASDPPLQQTPPGQVCTPCIHAIMNFLASDALRGRGSGTHDELVAATYVASQLEEYGIAPAGDQGGYLQRAVIVRRSIKTAPALKFGKTTWTHGKEMLAVIMPEARIFGPLQKLGMDKVGGAQRGAVVYLDANPGTPRPEVEQAAAALARAGAVAVLRPAAAGMVSRWAEFLGRTPIVPTEIEGIKPNAEDRIARISLTEAAAKAISALPDGAKVELKAEFAPTQKFPTWNVLGLLRGSAGGDDTVLLSAHLDHLGVGKAVNGDDIYNGADDDASGVTAVLEMARVLGAEARPKRNVLFALFGSEELGLLGSTYFREHTPVPLNDIIANLEFEMIGRPDHAVPEGTLWLTGWERTNLGPELAAHGARLVGDPHPEQNFFRRSDNYDLAVRGIVAQTVCSYGLHKDYHQPSDELKHIDFTHMSQSIQSMIKPIQWLVDSDFKPEWKEGMKP